MQSSDSEYKVAGDLGTLPGIETNGIDINVPRWDESKVNVARAGILR